ncbi:MAG: hypothetical protein HZB14_08180 [Actinobacteria bacterium]|nr:hypothetical protein [Actinomycetota bacterium]
MSAIRAFARKLFVAVRPHAGPVVLAFALSAMYFILDLRGGDLAAHLYRAELFKNDGFFVWNYNWYGGHYVVSYGVMFPTLAATIGVRLAGAFAYIAGVLLFSVLAREVFPRRGATAAAYVFAVVFSATLAIGQLPYALSVAIGLGALLAAAHARPWIALFLAINCALTSPLAALFISFISFTVWLAAWLPRRAADPAHEGDPRFRLGHLNVWAPIEQRPFLVVAAGTLLPAMVVSALFPEGGSQPFHVASYLGALAFTAFFWYFVRDDLSDDARRLVGIGVILYVVFLTGNELVASPIGGNAIRLGMILFPTVAAAALWPRAGRFALAIVIPLICWQGATAAWAIVTRDDTADPRYFAPVNAFLDRQDPGREEKVEIVFTRNHFEAAYIANRRPIARGWERQLDTKYNAVFYQGDLTPPAYAQWLKDNDVRWVALPDAPIDYSARAEAELIRGGLPYLERVSRLRDWNIYKVNLPAVGGLEPRYFDEESGRGFSIAPERYGKTLTRVRWQRFLRPSIGCIRSTDDGYLEIMLPEPPADDVSSRPPVVTITADFSLGRLVGSAPSCAEGWRVDEDDDSVRRDSDDATIGGTA